MKIVKILGAVAAVSVLIVTAMAIGLPLYGQSRDRDDRPSRRLQLPGLAGSELGMSVRDVDRADVTRQKLPAEAGAVIDEVRSDSPAAKAGLRAADVVVEFDGEIVRSARHFSRLVQETPPGRTVKATVIRDGQRVPVELTTESGRRDLSLRIPGDRLERLGPYLDFNFPRFELPDLDVDVRNRPGRLGVSVSGLGSQLADYFGVKEGVLVTSVGPDSAGAKAGLKAGDVITTVDGEAIRDPGTLRGRLSRIEGNREVTLGIVRDRKALTLKVQLEEQVERSRGRPI